MSNQSYVTTEELVTLIKSKGIKSLELEASGINVIISGVNFSDGSSCSIESIGDPVISCIDNNDGTEIWIKE